MQQLTMVLFLATLITSVWSANSPVWNFTVRDSMAHPADRFTQGLSWSGGELWESTGLVGKSSLFRSDRKGNVLHTVSIPPPHFGEGSTVVGDELVVLTWRSQVGFVYGTKDFKLRGSFPIPGEGWGLCLQDNTIWMSDGSARLWKLHRQSRDIIGMLEIRDSRGPVAQLNELEGVGKYLLANIWYSDSIAVIDPGKGNVVAYLDLSKIAKRIRNAHPGADVLNGLAWDGKSLWVTGKLWPKYYVLDIPGLTSGAASGIRERQK
jgi:glutamine cyclotransferase